MARTVSHHSRHHHKLTMQTLLRLSCTLVIKQHHPLLTLALLKLCQRVTLHQPKMENVLKRMSEECFSYCNNLYYLLSKQNFLSFWNVFPTYLHIPACVMPNFWWRARSPFFCFASLAQTLLFNITIFWGLPHFAYQMAVKHRRP